MTVESASAAVVPMMAVAWGMVMGAVPVYEAAGYAVAVDHFHGMVWWCWVVSRDDNAAGHRDNQRCEHGR